MKMTEIRQKAKTIGIMPKKMKKEELIHEIQRTESNTVCFGKAENSS